ncbi:serine/threonine protein kinase [Calothrix sp. CCY 0018]|uniref:serine/threonine protein kinase n=1 Tax=Calothrix sp. CCY 0018 TaxID=3103864 RepID=UPI0039C5ADAA
MNKKIIGDRYQVIYLLGKKPGYRTVLCSDIQTQQLVVVKFLVWDDDLEWQNLKLFEREAEVLKSIYHPAIPRYLDYFEVNQPHIKGFGLVQTYIKAESLEKHLQAGRTFNIEEVKELAESILKILIYLHSQQPAIIHRDIKPSNILLTNRSGNNIGNVYLVDFGSVKTITASTSGTMTVVGTYGYMSPEHFGGKVVPISDLYSLGATLIYLITGMHPANLPQKDGKIQFEKLVNCSEGFANWLKQMVEPVEEQRFSSAKIALQSLKQPSNKLNDLSYKKPINLKKPFGSKILLNKSKNRLEIVFPRQKITQLKNDLIFLGIKIYISTIILPFLLLIALLLLSTIFYGLGYSISIFSILFALILLILFFGVVGICIALIVSVIDDSIKALTNLFRRERLWIDRKKLCLSFDCLCFKSWLIRSISLTKINNLGKILIAGNRPLWVIAANIGGNQYNLIDKNDLTEVEIDWLYNELSEYLDLPLKNT